MPSTNKPPMTRKATIKLPPTDKPAAHPAAKPAKTSPKMPDTRSARLAETLVGCSLTPRSGRRYLEEITRGAERASATEHFYTEARLAMLEGDTETARTLFETAGPNFKRAGKYARQCELYDELCRGGAIRRPDEDGMCALLATMLDEPADAIVVYRYAEALRRNGYRTSTVERLTHATADAAIECAGMLPGHRACVLMHVDARSPVLERLFMRVVRACEECAKVSACVKGAAQAAEAVQAVRAS